MRILDLTTAATAVLLGAVPLASAQAQDGANRDSVQADARLVRHALAGNMLEVRLGEVAQHKAGNKAVQGFAQRMVTDHQRLEDQWKDLARKYGITVTDTLGPMGKQRVQHMQGVDRSSFDKDYMTAMLKAHADDVDHLRTVMDSVHSAPVRKLVDYERPIILDHLKAAAAAAKEVGVDSTVVNRSKEVAEGKARS